MKNHSHTTPRMLAAALLAAMAMLGSTAFARDGHASHGMGYGWGSSMGKHSAHAPQRMLDGLTKAVNASPEQRSKIETILKAAHDDARKLHSTAHEGHEKMRALMSAATLDKASIEQQRAALSAVHEQLSRRHHQAMLDAAEVLTPAQRAQLAERMKERHARHERKHSAG